jgi:hypothetical protein
MPLGVDDAGSLQQIWLDGKAERAFDEIGFDYLSHHVNGDPPVEEVKLLDRWAQERNCGYLLNQEGAIRSPGDPAVYTRPGTFFQPSEEYVKTCVSSPRFMGFTYDEVEHWINDGGWPTIEQRIYAPHFFDAKGETLEHAYTGNVFNLLTLMKRVYPGFAENAQFGKTGPVVNGEFVFPVLHHLVARAGFVPTPKYLMDGITPVNVAVGMGASKEYGLRYWAHVDLWGQGKYPGHTPEELRSALLYTYWTGAEHTTIENLAYNGSLYSETSTGIELSPLGRAARDFRREYLPAHPRTIHFEDFSPEIIIVRFPDSDWGQTPTGTWVTGYLYGAPNLLPDEETRYWIKIWHVISHGTMPIEALSYVNPAVTQPFRLMFPVNNVAVYDHLAADPMLYKSARLVFLTGKLISATCMSTLKHLVRTQGITIVTTTRLAPNDLRSKPTGAYAEHKDGEGRWIITDDVTQPEVVRLLQPYLGSPNQLRYVFGNTEVSFTQFDPAKPAHIEVKKIDTKINRRCTQIKADEVRS